MRSTWRCIRVPDLFGAVRALEPPNLRPDLRNVLTFAEQLERELARAEAIRRDPFKHLPYHFPTLAQIAALQTRTRVFARCWLSDRSKIISKLWGANTPTGQRDGRYRMPD